MQNPHHTEDQPVNLFDILGPVMVGPSSSHTAGAVRIGRIARRLLGEGTPRRAVITLSGSFAATGRGHGTDRALVAGLLLSSKFIKKPLVRALFAGVVGEAVMVLGYLVYEAFVLGYGAAAIGGVPMNLIQGVFGVAAGAALYLALLKTKYFDNF